MSHTDCGCTPSTPLGMNRRQAIRSLVGGSLLMPGIVARLLADDDRGRDPLAPRAAQFPARAERVIFVFLAGGFSQLDTFDFKPRLVRDHGREMADDGTPGKKSKTK